MKNKKKNKKKKTTTWTIKKKKKKKKRGTHPRGRPNGRAGHCTRLRECNSLQLHCERRPKTSTAASHRCNALPRCNALGYPCTSSRPASTRASSSASSSSFSPRHLLPPPAVHRRHLEHRGRCNRVLELARRKGDVWRRRKRPFLLRGYSLSHLVVGTGETSRARERFYFHRVSDLYYRRTEK